MKNRIINLAAFGILTILWIAFFAVLIFNRDLLSTIWQVFRGWPLVLQIIIGLLTLPVMIGLWVWQTTWSIWIRLILIIGLAWVTVYTFFPKKTSIQAVPMPKKS